MITIGDFDFIYHGTAIYVDKNGTVIGYLDQPKIMLSTKIISITHSRDWVVVQLDVVF